MSKLLKQRQAASLKLVEVLEDGSARTFIYENLDRKAGSNFLVTLGARIKRKLRSLPD